MHIGIKLKENVLGLRIYASSRTSGVKRFAWMYGGK
jgi:hypothetical protein